MLSEPAQRPGTVARTGGSRLVSAPVSLSRLASASAERALPPLARLALRGGGEAGEGGGTASRMVYPEGYSRRVATKHSEGLL
ncbi:MAG: hypothetical protein QME51_11010 [Planctomycetota bacterium]|nr:hypothetical protein [Planctomycetota bacterium]